MQFRVIVVTDPHTHTHTHPQTGPITIHCTAASVQCNNLDQYFRWIMTVQAFTCM